MSRRIFQLLYKRDVVTSEEMMSVHSQLESIFDTDKDLLIIMPDDYKFSELTTEELLRLRKNIDDTISGNVKAGHRFSSSEDAR